MQHLLVPTDFSETANAALDHAIPLAEMAGARITLLHVIYSDNLNERLLGLDAIELLAKTMNPPSDPSGYVPSYDFAELRTAAEKKLNDLARKVNRPKLSIAAAVRDGRPYQEIIRFADENGVDMIVIGTHGRGPVGRMFLGSVTENVVRGASCPVMVVRN